MTATAQSAPKSSPLSGSIMTGIIAVIGYTIFIAIAASHDRSAVLVYLRDPAAHHKFSPFSGIISNMGVLATFSAAAICLFAAKHAKAEAALLFAVGLLGVFVALDDLLMLHEDLFPLRLGVSEYFIYGAYLLTSAFIAIRFRAELVRGPKAGLCLAVLLLGSSVALDVVTKFSSMETIFEDGLKFIGLLVWSVYWITRASTAVLQLDRKANFQD